jgi:thymidine phosphorylase
VEHHHRHPAELIRRKRDGHTLAEAEIARLVGGIADGSLSDAQVGALAMAFFLHGMEPGERVALTRAMTHSGERLEWPELDRPVLDKHSTGGVGDKVSLLLAPIVAACGGAVPMISGRGLGHTGGTLDKLDAIPGYDSTPGLDRLRAAVREAGCAIVGQTAELAPADRRLYAIRDATGTVESLPLIVASILSKKLAAGLDALVMDVKLGSGAFLPERDEAEALARALVDVAHGAGLHTVALITDMDAVLGTTAGNALEVREALDMVRGRGPADFTELVLDACAKLLALSDLGIDESEGRRRAEAAVSDGSAEATWRRWIEAQGGTADESALPVAPVIRELTAPVAGYVSQLSAIDVGNAAVHLGAGRRTKDDAIDHAVGIVLRAKRGDRVEVGQTLAEIHARTDDQARFGAGEVLAAYEISDVAPAERPVLLEVVG